MKCYTCHNIMNSYFFSNNKKNTTYPSFYSKCLVFSHKNISHISLTCKSSWSNFLQQPASKSSFDHIQEVHVLVLSIRPRCKKNKSKFHLYLWEKNNLLLGSTFESRWNQGYIYYTSTILTEKNSSSQMQSDWKWPLFRNKKVYARWNCSVKCFVFGIRQPRCFFFRFSFHVTLFFL